MVNLDSRSRAADTPRETVFTFLAVYLIILLLFVIVYTRILEMLMRVNLMSLQ